MASIVVLAVTVAAVVLSSVTGRSGGADSAGGEGTTTSVAPSPFDQERGDAVGALLDRWAEAVRSGDVGALRTLMDSRADPSFVEAQMRRAADAPAVPFAQFRYELGTEPETPVPSSIAQPLAATDVWAPPVYLSYAIDGPDRSPTRRAVSLIVARRDGAWRLVSDADLPDNRRHTWRAPWDFGPLTVRKVSTDAVGSVIVGHHDREQFVSNLAEDLPEAIADVTDCWGDDWARDAVVFVSSSVEEFGESTGSTPSPEVAAVTVSDAVTVSGAATASDAQGGSRTDVTGQRVVFGPDAATRLTPFTRRSVLRHELTHVAARARTVDGSPLWLTEGFADYCGYRNSGVDFSRLAPTLAAAVAANGPPSALPKDEDFAAGGARSSLAYESAWSVHAFLADRFGEEALRRFYEKLASGPGSAQSWQAASTSVLGATWTQLLASWGEWVSVRSR